MWVLILSLVVLGVVCYFADRWMRKTGRLTDEVKTVSTESSECCGEHAICEKESLLSFDNNVVYYDDEELDVFKGRMSDQYTGEEIKEFEEVFYTLQEEEVAGWVRSLQTRGIELPDSLKEEALMVIRERRFHTQKQ